MRIFSPILRFDTRPDYGMPALRQVVVVDFSPPDSGLSVVLRARARRGDVDCRPGPPRQPRDGLLALVGGKRDSCLNGRLSSSGRVCRRVKPAPFFRTRTSVPPVSAAVLWKPLAGESSARNRDCGWRVLPGAGDFAQRNPAVSGPRHPRIRRRQHGSAARRRAWRHRRHDGRRSRSMTCT